MKNKKLMLVAVAAMGLVAAGTAGVGTAAWYTVNNTVTIANPTVGNVLSATSTLDGDVTLSVAFTDGGAGNTSLSGIALTDDSGDTFVINKAGNLVEATSSHKYGIASMKVTSANSVDQLKAAAGEYTITVTGDSWTNKIVGDPTSEQTTAGIAKKAAGNKDASSRLKLGDGAEDYDADEELTYTIYITTSGTLSWTSISDAGTGAGTGVTKSIYVAIDGGNKTAGSLQNDKVDVIGELTAA